MIKHTPGPWKALGHQPHQQFIEIVHSNLNTPGAASGVVSRVTCRVTWQEEQQANAHLIAAAPELLEALLAVQRMIKWAEENTDSPKSALSHFIHSKPVFDCAIAKALNKPITE